MTVTAWAVYAILTGGSVGQPSPPEEIGTRLPSGRPSNVPVSEPVVVTSVRTSPEESARLQLKSMSDNPAFARSTLPVAVSSPLRSVAATPTLNPAASSSFTAPETASGSARTMLLSPVVTSGPVAAVLTRREKSEGTESSASSRWTGLPSCALRSPL